MTTSQGIGSSGQDNNEKGVSSSPNISDSSNRQPPITDPALPAFFVALDQATTHSEEIVTKQITGELPNSVAVLQNTDDPIAVPLPIAQLSSPSGTPNGAHHPTLFASPRRLFWLIIGICIVLLITLGGLLAYVHAPVGHSSSKPQPKTHDSSTSMPNEPPTSVSSAIITLTPDQQEMEDTVTLQAVTGTPTDPQNQVQVRKVTVTMPPVVETADASGIGIIPAIPAKGTVIIDYTPPYGYLIPAGSIFPPYQSAPISQRVVTDQDVHVGSYPGGQTHVIVPAHALIAGAQGNNIPAGYDMRSGNGIHVVSGPFTGGVDQSTYPYIQQNDIDKVSNDLIKAHRPDTTNVWNSLRQKLHIDEKFIGQPLCQPQTSTSQPVGDKVAKVTVSVVFACLAYAHQGVEAAAQNQLHDLVKQQLGSGYVLQGDISTTIQSTDVIVIQYGPEGDFPGIFSVEAKGTWKFQPTDAQKQQWLNAIAGKNQQEALAFLQGQQGIKGVTIQFQGKNQETLPTDPQNITWKMAT